MLSVGGGDPAFYGLSTINGSQLWRNPMNVGSSGFPWESPLINGNQVYLGIASRCDNPSVRGGKFKWDLKLNRDPADMNRDPRTIYPLASDEYEIVVTFDPRTQAPFIQDVYGWNGEGITDPKYLVIDNSRHTCRVVWTNETQVGVMFV